MPGFSNIQANLRDKPDAPDFSFYFGGFFAPRGNSEKNFKFHILIIVSILIGVKKMTKIAGGYKNVL